MRRKKLSAYKPQKRVFQCTECGIERTAIKYHGKTNPGHIKTMWCFHCDKNTDYLQIE